MNELSVQAIDLLHKYSVEELIPEKWQPSHMQLSDALLLLHRPANDVDIISLEQGMHPAQQRLVFEELLAQNLSLLKVREQGQQVSAVSLSPTNTLEGQFLAQLPFAPTNAVFWVAHFKTNAPASYFTKATDYFATAKCVFLRCCKIKKP